MPGRIAGFPARVWTVDAEGILAMLNSVAIDVRDLSADSRAVTPGAVFLAYPGHGGAQDGRQHVPDALQRGAAA